MKPMEFNEKLDFLLKLAGLSNSSLAKEINVDASLVSKWRHGQRSPESKPELLMTMAQKLAQRISYNSLKQELADAMGADVQTLAGANEMAEAVFVWLRQSPREAKRGQEGIEETQLYSGFAGWQNALARFGAVVKQRRAEGVLRIFCDEPQRWLQQAHNMLKKEKKNHFAALQNFKEVRFIVPANLPAQEFSLFWNAAILFSDVTTVRLSSLYRMNVGVFQHSVIIAGKCCAITSFGFYGKESTIALLLGQGEEIGKLIADFDELYDQCDLILRHLPNFSYWDALDLIKRLLCRQGDVYYQSTLLPAFIAPQETMQDLFWEINERQAPNPQIFGNAQNMLEQFLEKNKLFLTFLLATPQQVTAGEVKHVAGVSLTCGQYARMLNRLLQLHKNYPNLRVKIVFPRQLKNTWVLQDEYLLFFSKAPQDEAYFSTNSVTVKEMKHCMALFFDEADATPAQRRTTRKDLMQYLRAFKRYLS